MIVHPGNAAATGYNLTRSLRFRASASASLSRTPASAGDRKKFTWSGLVKRGALGVYQGILSGGSTSPSYDVFEFDINTNRLAFFQSGGTTTALYTNAVFRDPAAYYHIVFAYDSAQATAANRVLIYVNGVLQTLTGTFPTLNLDSFINTTFPQAIGAVAASGTFIYPFDGYMADVYFIDGQALTPASFGETNALTGVWQPKAYVGTYGTDGFYLDFEDNSALTTSSNVGLGKDTSGNGNYWTTNNISLTAGFSYDSMTDVPTLTSATAANYAVLNPLSGATTSLGLSNGNLRYVWGGASNINMLSTMPFSSGKIYLECLQATGANTDLVQGFVEASFNSGLADLVLNTSFFGYTYAGRKWSFGSQTSGNPTLTVNTTVMHFAVDFDAGKAWVGGGGTWFGSGDPATGANPYWTFTPNTAYQFAGAIYNASGTVNFGQQPWAHTPPTGFVALNTFNIPAGSITTSGSFIGNVSADGPSIYLNGVPTAMTINGNAVTFGTHADKTAYGFKVRSSSTSYNSTGTNTYSITTTGAKFKFSNAQGNP